MGKLNKNCSCSNDQCGVTGAGKVLLLENCCKPVAPVLRVPSSRNARSTFTLIKKGKSAKGDDLVEIQTYSSGSRKEPL